MANMSVVSFQVEICPVTSELVKQQDVSSVRTTDPDRADLSSLHSVDFTQHSICCSCFE